MSNVKTYAMQFSVLNRVRDEFTYHAIRIIGLTPYPNKLTFRSDPIYSMIIAVTERSTYPYMGREKINLKALRTQINVF